MWRSLGLCLSVVVLVNCSAPSRYFASSAATRVDMGGNMYDVRVRGELAESVRTNLTYAPRLGPIQTQAAAAMRAVSGCEVVRVLGDAAVQLGQLDCGSATAQDQVPLPPPRYECLEFPTGIVTEDGWEYVDFDCKPYWR